MVQGNLHVAVDVPVNDCLVGPARDDLQTFVWVFLSSVKGEFQRYDTRRMVFQMVDVLVIVLTLEDMDQPVSRPRREKVPLARDLERGIVQAHHLLIMSKDLLDLLTRLHLIHMEVSKHVTCRYMKTIRTHRHTLHLSCL